MKNENKLKQYFLNNIFNRTNLVIIILLLLILVFWIKRNEGLILGEFISLASGLVSIALAFVAIIIAVSESFRANETETKTNQTLDVVIKNVKDMSGLIESLKSEQNEFHNSTNLTLSNVIEHMEQSEKYYNIEFEVEESTQLGQNDTEPVTHINENIFLENKNKHTGLIKRGDIFFADLSPVVGHELGGTIPVLVISNDITNRYSPTIGVAVLTTKIPKAKLLTHVEIKANEYGLERDSVILLDQMRTIDKSRILEKVTQVDSNIMETVDVALSIQYGIIKL